MKNLHRLAISSEHRAQLRRALDAALPRECCGVLLGSNDNGRLDVRWVLTTLNAATMVGGFSIPDHEIRRVRLLAAQCGEPIIALFHSHPGGSTELSESDRRALAYSEWPWVIVTQAAKAGDIELRYHEISA
jgi:proteasome lid subunit RPN8/RPN11